MNKKTFSTLGRLSLAGLVMAGSTVAAQAAPVVLYTFDDSSGFTTAVNSIGSDILSATSWVPGAGVIDSRSGVSGQALRLGGWDESQFLEFQFTIAPNTALTLDGLNFAERFGGVGGGAGGGGGSPQTFTGWNFLVDGVEQASGAASAPGGADPFETVSQPLSVGGLSGLVTIRLTADGPFVPGSWFIDNFELTGTFAPVPLPPAAWLFGSALVGLAARRRRAA